MNKVWLYGLGLVVAGMACGVILISTSRASITCINFDNISLSNTYPICGDTADAFDATGDIWCPSGPTDIPCECGDTVLTTTKLDEATDPVVSSGPGDVCPDDALFLTDGVTLDCDGLGLRGDFTGDGVEVEGVSGVTVKRCTIRNFGTGIDVFESSDFTLDSNKVKENVFLGILVEDSSQGTVKNNTASNNFLSVGIFLSDADHITVDKNKASNNGEVGIGLVGLCSNNVITNNTAKNNQFAGIGLDLDPDATANTLDHNKVSRNEGDGILLLGGHDNFITNNEATHNTEDGIDIESEDNVVAGNTGHHNGTDADFDNGLEVVEGTGNAVTNNVFNSNARHGVCAIPGNTDGGGNKGKNNGVPPDVSFNDATCGEPPI